MPFRPLSDGDFENVASGEERLLLSQEGIYPARLICWHSQLHPLFGEKLIFDWNVFLSPALDKYESCKLLRYYNVKRENGKPFFGHHHEYRKDWIAANNGRRPFVRSSLPPKVFEKKLFLIGIKTVCKDSKGDLQPSVYYSRVDRIIRPLEDGEEIDRVPVQAIEKMSRRSA